MCWLHNPGNIAMLYFLYVKKYGSNISFILKKMEQSNNLQEIINDPKLPERKIEKVKLYKCIEKLDDW